MQVIHYIQCCAHTNLLSGKSIMGKFMASEILRYGILSTYPQVHTFECEFSKAFIAAEKMMS